MSVWRGFASDNYAGIHPEILEAIAAVNDGHQVAYGGDEVTAALERRMVEIFGTGTRVFPVFNGTGANVVALSALTPRWGGVIAAQSAHIAVDEGGAPEKMAGLKLHLIPTLDGKLTPELIATQAWGFGDVHRAQPAVVSITQSTELGTLYTLEEIAAIAQYVHSLGMYLHMDGARLANAAAALGVGLRAMTRDLGVDILSFGGTKNGAMLAEAVIVFDEKAVDALGYLRKSSMQLASKMRFISAQLLALVKDDLWLRNAQVANEMARFLANQVSRIEGVVLTRQVEANAVFAILPSEVTAKLLERFRFYIWDQQSGEVRWMCSWDTRESDVIGFVRAIEEEMRQG